MDISQELLIDVGLNLIGYLAAGVLSVLLYSLCTRSAKVGGNSQSFGADPSRLTASDLGKSLTAEPKTDPSLEFIDFGNSDGAISVSKPSKPAAQPPQVAEDYRRNRLKIIRTARQMLNAGTPENKVKSLLPISEAELSLLMIGKG